MKPIIKWAGGKTQLLDEIMKRIPLKYNSYIEPFIGGGSVFFALEPSNAIINDLNEELINLYRTVKHYPNALVKSLKIHEDNVSEEYYYKIRELDRIVGLKNLNHIYRASRFLFLNKTGYNGLYRVNSEGFMNVPFGKRTSVNLYDDNLFDVSNFLRNSNIVIKNQDYKKLLLSNVKAGDFVYLDPPYHPITQSSSFTAYQKDGFNEVDQLELRDVCIEIHKRKAYFMLSNSSSDFIKDIYSVEGFVIEEVKARRSINSNGNLRGDVLEVLITNYNNKGEF